ncbi:MAG TPA: alpha/beta hydrolase domain-containing protein, partial [Vicinamibacterales bacterium]|nr:alpha/beta hydrolase domain-containing protein [Vicinamibacterales bacterium]
GQPATLRCHYTYALPFVLRIPPDWSGGLVTFRHGAAALALWEQLEADLGSRSIGRIFHETSDRMVSDVALQPGRRWAFFAVNYVGVAPGGTHNTLVLGGEPGCTEGTPTQGIADVTITRDHALLARHLLKTLRGREPSMVFGAGHSAGGTVHMLLNAGVDHRRAGVVQVGDNHLTPYDETSGRIFDGFLSLQGGAGPPLPSASTGGVTAPTIFISTDVDRPGTFGTINAINEMALNPALHVPDLARLYTVRNMPHLDSDFVLSAARPGSGPTDPVNPEYLKGGGERLKPLTGALLDALARWATEGVPPPPSLFNGEFFTCPDRIVFHRTSPSTTAFPIVDDVSLDTHVGLPNPPAPLTPAQRTAWVNVRTALGAAVGSIVLPETACRRSGLHFLGAGPIGAAVTPFDEPTFLARWGTQAAHQTCRVETVEALAAIGLYDETVVTVDVLPEAFPNVVHLAEGGRLPVAILSTARFDATEIVPGSLRMASATSYGGAEHPADVQASEVDVNGDGRLDLLVQFRLERLRLTPGDIVVDLWGRSSRGDLFTGSDLVDVVE